MNHRLLVVGAGLALLAVVSSPLCAQPAQGKKMAVSVTTTVHMHGMALPPRTVTRNTCMASAEVDPRQLIQAHLKGDCKLDDYVRKGRTTTYHLHCTQPVKVTGDGKLVATADGGFTGSQKTDVVAAGRSMQVDTAYKGVPHGTCVYTPKQHG